MKKLLIYILLLVPGSTVCGQDSLQVDSIKTNSEKAAVAKHVTKAEADSAYMRTDYASAIQIYEQLLEYGEAAEIYYNLGNSYYKTGEIAKAILNYERALLLKPNNEDIRVNLEIARGKTVDKVNAIPELFFIAWGKSFINSLGVDSWGILGILSFVLLLVSLCCFIFMKRFLWRRIAFSLSIVLVFVCAWSNLAASQQKKNLLIRNDAIIMLPSVIVRSTPDESGTSLFILHEGRKVSVDVNDSMKEWKEIRLEDGKVGWVPAQAIEFI